MKPLDFYRWAVTEAATATSEAQCRSVISRLYYGIHHEVCCRYFRGTPPASPLPSQSRHSELRNRLNDAQRPRLATMANLLGQLLHMRTEADYQLTLPLRLRNGRNVDTACALVQHATRIGEELLRELEAHWPGEAPDGCECKVVQSFGSR